MTDGSWNLTSYVPEVMAHFPFLPPMRSGFWTTINDGHELIRMSDGKILDWHAKEWRLATLELRPFEARRARRRTRRKRGVEHNRQCHRLVAMPDGLLSTGAADGTWRLWNYDPKHESDILPGPQSRRPVASIDPATTCTPWATGRFWTGSDHWCLALWNYDPTKPDILPRQSGRGRNWATIREGHQLIGMMTARSWTGTGIPAPIAVEL